MSNSVHSKFRLSRNFSNVAFSYQFKQCTSIIVMHLCSACDFTVQKVVSLNSLCVSYKITFQKVFKFFFDNSLSFNISL